MATNTRYVIARKREDGVEEYCVGFEHWIHLIIESTPFSDNDDGRLDDGEYFIPVSISITRIEPQI